MKRIVFATSVMAGWLATDFATGTTNPLTHYVIVLYLGFVIGALVREIRK